MENKVRALAKILPENEGLRKELSSRLEDEQFLVIIADELSHLCVVLSHRVRKNRVTICGAESH